MAKAQEWDYFGDRICCGATIYPYQLAFGVSVRYWPCLFMPNVRVHFGPLKTERFSAGGSMRSWTRFPSMV